MATSTSHKRNTSTSTSPTNYGPIRVDRVLDESAHGISRTPTPSNASLHDPWTFTPRSPPSSSSTMPPYTWASHEKMPTASLASISTYHMASVPITAQKYAKAVLGQFDSTTIQRDEEAAFFPPSDHNPISDVSTMPISPMVRSRPKDSSSKTIGIITKTPYIQPQHPKIKCSFCNERPEGFRSSDELDRHIAKAHAPSRKGYICIDASADEKFLASCKHCRNKKVYGAYYNAAAHLRRAYFHPRKRGRKGKNDEKRSGIGGGDNPPMDYLKQHWIREIEVETTTNPNPHRRTSA